ncbi:MAG: aldose 1-epimerase [Saprospiraceae bacterium]
MFQLDVTNFGKYSSRRYYTEDNTISFAIVPERGALLSDFQYNGHPIIDGCKTPEEVEFNAWGKSWLLFPFPNRLKDGQYKWEGKSYQFPINEEQNQHALHGFLHECAFDLVNEEVGEQKVHLHLQHAYAGERPYYPFPFLFELFIEVNNAGKFRMDVMITNNGASDLPMAFGWHPYFQLGGKVNDWWLQTSAIDLIGIDKRMIPTGKKYEFDKFAESTKINAEVLDNCFEARGKFGKNAEATLTDQRLQIQFSQPALSFPYLQLFTPPNRQSLAIEPMTGNVDCFNNRDRLIRLTPTEKWWGTYHFTVTHV